MDEVHEQRIYESAQSIAALEAKYDNLRDSVDMLRETTERGFVVVGDKLDEMTELTRTATEGLDHRVTKLEYDAEKGAKTMGVVATILGAINIPQLLGYITKLFGGVEGTN